MRKEGDGEHFYAFMHNYLDVGKIAQNEKGKERRKGKEGGKKASLKTFFFSFLSDVNFVWHIFSVMVVVPWLICIADNTIQQRQMFFRVFCLEYLSKKKKSLLLFNISQLIVHTKFLFKKNIFFFF